MQEGFGFGSLDAGLALAWSAHLFGCTLPVARLGHPQHRQRYLQSLFAGERIGALAHVETGGGFTGVATRARAHGDRWILDGHKVLVANAPIADLFVVSAITDPERGAAGVTTFLVERDAPGVNVGARIATSGLRTLAIADLTLEGCALGPDAVLGELGGGLVQTLRLARLYERALGLAPFIGILRALLDASTRRLRAANGGTQASRARLVDMRIEIDLAQRMQRQIASRLDRGEDAQREAVVARLTIARAIRRVVQHAVELEGSDALRPGSTSERLRRDAQALALFCESEDLLRSMLGGALVGLG
jgi:alkylation response protein AidB-like acyl-CoA dehydrogenase